MRKVVVTGLCAWVAIVISMAAPLIAHAQAPGAPTPQQAQAACDKGNMLACATLGQMLTTGKGVPVDLVAGYALYKKACDGGYKEACVEQAIGLSTGRGVAVDKAAAVALGDQACASGNAVACLFTGIQYAQGAGVSPNPTKALAYFEKSCGGGFAQGCAARDQIRTSIQAANTQATTAPAPARVDATAAAIQGLRVPRIGQPLVPEKGRAPAETLPLMQQADALFKASQDKDALKIWYQACEQDNAEACAISRTQSGYFKSVGELLRRLSERSCNLGSAKGCWQAASDFKNQYQGSVDRTKARSYLVQSCRFGSLEACELLTYYYFEGEPDFEKDLAAAAVKGEETCAVGGGLGCYYVGQLFELGRYLNPDLEAAKNYYQRGCALSAPENCSALGGMLESGRAGKKDVAAALATFEQGCKMSGRYESSCANAARMYFRGIGVPTDLQKATELASKSCVAYNDEECRENLTLVLAASPSRTDPDVGLRQAEAFCVNGTMTAVCGLLGQAVYDGKGISDNKTRGRTLFSAACAAGHRDSCIFAERKKNDTDNS